ncbi:uncharacterized protein [Glycine max]|uniref:uncharacterized protein n=1 Tax=Glycine max TaxID=3847 RepID=UPI0007194329|nr:uncharacterized protein LOC106799682 [Glycine max]|eukprot:XP_014634078.1 uncharacterized protein LOC106799682 [Glycine max]
MGHKPSQKVSLSFFGPLYRNINKGYNLVFFIFGVSLGIAAVLCLNLSFSLQAFLYPVITPITTILPSPLSSSRLLSVTAPPSLKSFSSSQNTMFNSPSIELKTSLMHNMTYQELFLKASSMISGTQDFTEQTVPKVAFMFLARGPLPLAPLWEKFFKGHDGFYSIYLHQHPCFSETMPEDSVFYGRNIPSEVSLPLLIFISLQTHHKHGVIHAT